MIGLDDDDPLANDDLLGGVEQANSSDKSPPAASSSSVKNSKVLALKARANYWNILEICGSLEAAPLMSGIIIIVAAAVDRRT